MKNENLTKKDIEQKIKDLKIELLRKPEKRKNIKKEIARLLTLTKLNKIQGEKS